MADPIHGGIPLSRMNELPELATQAKGATDGSFTDLLKSAVNDASDLESNSQQLIAAFLRGEPVELHQVMAASEEASISLQLLVEIRNKLTEAYRSVMNMQ
jgi:flagellar hook-basal body complex protein FliE